MAQNKKFIVVTGATGNQGSSVAHTFLNLPEWHVRCVTRNPSSLASQALAVLGAEVVQADLSDLASLPPAFELARAIFLNTDFWTKYRRAAVQGEGGKPKHEVAFEQEVLHGKNAAVAAANVPSLEHLVYAALGPLRSTPRENTRESIVDYIEREEPPLAKKTSFIYLGAYITNAILSLRLDPASGKYRFGLPLKKDELIPIIDAKESTGPLVRALVEDEAAGTKLLAYDSYLGLGEVVDLWSRASGKEATLVEVSLETMHQQFGIPWELLDGLGFIGEFGYTGGIEAVTEPPQLKIKVKARSYETWLTERDWKEVLD